MAGGGALVSLAVLGGGAKEPARGTETASGGLEVLEDVLDERGLRGGAVGAAHKVAAEGGGGGGGAGAADLETAAGGDDRVLLGFHRLVEKGRVGGGHVLDWGHDWRELRIILWHITARPRAHVAVLGLP